MVQPSLPHGLWNRVRFEGLYQNLAAPGKVAAHNRMLGMGDIERSPSVGDRRAKKFRRELVFHFFDAISVRVAKEKPDHSIVEHAVDKCIYNDSEFGFAAQLFKETGGVRTQLVLILAIRIGVRFHLSIRNSRHPQL